jgi:2-keto-4-pentenoate hydratase/2-oxohepta-3-ene-1,7-dioic acid hydratase in catechol pathway
MTRGADAGELICAVLLGGTEIGEAGDAGGDDDDDGANEQNGQEDGDGTDEARSGTFYDLNRLLIAQSGVSEAEAALAQAILPRTPLEAAIGAGRLAPALDEAVARLHEEGRLDEFALPLDTVCLRAPIPRPNRILAIGRNYAEHAKEQGKTVADEPIVFLKASTTVIGPDENIEIPAWVGRVDYEGELLVVLGPDPDESRNGKNVPEEAAMDLVVGYTLFNDVTARELQRADQARQHPWFRSKSLDTFGPLGPYLVTRDEIADPHDLRLTLQVNAETKQDDTTGSMVYSIPALIAFLSRHFRLEAGDVIATGTPSGIGPLAPGDIVTVSAPGLGTLINPVVVAAE